MWVVVVVWVVCVGWWGGLVGVGVVGGFYDSLLGGNYCVSSKAGLVCCPAGFRQ